MGICLRRLKHDRGAWAIPSNEIDYPLNVYASILKENVGEEHQKVADLGSTCQWQQLMEFLKTRKDLVNTCRLPVDKSSSVDLCTPLHYAAKGGAPKEVFEELVKMGASKTLKNNARETAYDIAKKTDLSDEILEIIKEPDELAESKSEVENMENGLHKVILGRCETLITENGQQLPQLAFLYEFKDFWYPVPMMYGGFHVFKHDDGIQAVSFCRVAGGSGERHVIDRKGNVELVEDGFY